MILTLSGVFMGIVLVVLYIYIIYNTLDKILPYILMKRMLKNNAPKLPKEFLFLVCFSLTFSFYYVYLGVILINTLFGG